MRTMVDGMPPNKKTKKLSVEECAEMFPGVNSDHESVSNLEPNKKSPGPGPYRCSSTGMLVQECWGHVVDPLIHFFLIVGDIVPHLITFLCLTVCLMKYVLLKLLICALKTHLITSLLWLN